MIDQAYRVVDDSAGWADCLDALLRLQSFDACGLYRYDRRERTAAIIAARGYGAGFEQVDRGMIGSAALLLSQVLTSSAPGAVWLEADLAQRLALRETPIWQHWLLPKGFEAWGCAVIERDVSGIIYLEFLGKQGRPPFGGETLRQLHQLSPHLRRAWQLHACFKRERSLIGAARTAVGATLGAGLGARLDPGPGAGPAAPLRSSDLPFEVRLRCSFQLTKAEARVAALLCNGMALKAIAARLHVSIHTVRSQLQSIYQKTETSRQAELISLLLHEAEWRQLPAARCS